MSNNPAFHGRLISLFFSLYIHQSSHEFCQITTAAHLTIFLLLCPRGFVSMKAFDEMQRGGDRTLPFSAQSLCFPQLALDPVGLLLLNDLDDLLGHLIRAARLSHDAFQTHTNQTKFLFAPSVKAGTC